MEVNESETLQSRIRKVLDLKFESSIDILVLPELWLTGAFLDPCETPLEIFEELQEFSRRHNLLLFAGSIAIKTGEKYQNSVVVFDSGKSFVSYSKLHLFGFDQGEKLHFTSGNSFHTFSRFGVDIGLAICFDLRFPEMFGKLRDNGVSIIVIPAAWPQSRIRHWETLLKARAIENQFLVVGCNAVGTQNGITLGGNSMIVDPLGNVLSQSNYQSQVLAIVDFELGEIARSREDFPVHREKIGDYENISFIKN